MRKLKLNACRPRFLPKCSLPLALLLLALGASPAHAATVIWTNTSGGNWNTAANWSPNKVPAAGDAVLITQPGDYTVLLNGSASVASLTLGGGSGQQRLTNAANTLTVSGSATVAANGVLDWAGGSVTGGGQLQVNANGTLNWSGGSFDGPLTVATNGVLNLGGTATRRVTAPLTNWGTITWMGGDVQISFGYGDTGRIYNQAGALFDARCDQTFQAYNYSGAEFFSNQGTFRKSAGTGTTAFSDRVRFDNTGTVEVQQGTLALNGGGTVGGSYSAAVGSTINLNGGDFVQSGLPVFSGAGQKMLTGGSLTLTTDVIAGLTLMGGDLWLSPSFQGGNITNLTLSGVTLRGTNTVGGVLHWMSGSINGPLTVATNGVLNLGGTASRYVSEPLTNWGTINWAGGQFTMKNQGNLYNQPGALFDVQCDQPLAWYNGSEFIVNAGTFRKSAAGGTTTVQVAVTNTGTVLAQSGTLNFNGVFTQTDGLTLLTNGNLAASSPLRILGGRLAGHGTITGSVTNAGTVAPGWPLGRITITGEYTQTETGVLQIELAGMAPGTNYDRLGANTAARLAGTLEVTLANGFYPETNALFTYLTTTTRSGTFSTFLYPSNDIGLRTNYGATVASVSVINVRPVLAAIPSQNADEQAAWTCTASAADADRPVQSLTYWLTNSPPQAGIDPVSGLMSWTPTEAEGPCTTNFTVCVTDNGTPPLTVRRTFAVTVNEINAPPELTPPADQALDELTLLNVRATASDPDQPANPLTFSLVSGPEDVAVSPDGEITWTPGEAQGPGEYTVQVRVTDTNAAAVNQRALSATNHFTVTVREVNQPPVLDAIPERQTNPGQTVNFTLPAHDADLPANGLNFALLSGPTNATVEAGSGVFTWRPRIGEAQTTNLVLVQVRDDGQPSLGATQEFAVVVGPLAEVRLTASGAEAEQFVFELAGQEGPDYTVQVATNLESPDWVTAFRTNLSTPTAILTNTFPAGSADQRFYRVLIGP